MIKQPMAGSLSLCHSNVSDPTLLLSRSRMCEVNEDLSLIISSFVVMDRCRKATTARKWNDYARNPPLQ
jgi:hypothetical protein